MSLPFCDPQPIAGVVAVGLLIGSLAPPALAQPPCTTRGNPRSTTYQFRAQMDRCEGMRGSRPIAAVGLRLASYTIGQPQIQPRHSRGEVLSLQVPAIPAGQGDPSVTVQARGGDYQMTPLRLGNPQQGWRDFVWGAGLLQQEGISATQLRATALLSQSGSADQWLPVKFAPAGAYSLVIASNGAQPLANVRILGSDRRLVHECTGPTRLETELVCRWNGRDREGRISPAGRYLLIARPAEGGNSALNVSLRHDPRWLLP